VLTLYYQLGCVHSLRARLVLAEKLLPFSRRIVREDDRPSELIDMSGGEVPVLLDGSFAVTDSMVIAEYLEDSFAKPALRPFDARGRAVIRGAARRMDRELLGPLELLETPGRTASDRRVTPGAEAVAAWSQALEGWEHKLGDNGLLFGMEFSLADVWLVSAVEKARASGWEPDSHLPKLRVWLARVLERACVATERLA
jgi:glutathione S-transferase